MFLLSDPFFLYCIQCTFPWLNQCERHCQNPNNLYPAHFLHPPSLLLKNDSYRTTYLYWFRMYVKELQPLFINSYFFLVVIWSMGDNIILYKKWGWKIRTFATFEKLESLTCYEDMKNISKFAMNWRLRLRA